MNVPDEELNRWLDRVNGVNRILLPMVTQGGQAAEGALAAQMKLNGLRQALLRYGAVEADSVPTQVETFDLPDKPTPTAVAYAHAIREAATLAVQWDKERGISDGPSEIVEDWAASVEDVVFGRKGRD